MPALLLLHHLCQASVELRVRGADLAFRAPIGVLATATLEEIRNHKAELIRLLDGTTCRWCRGAIVWRGTTAVVLADGTSLHGECREAFEIARIARSAEAAVHPALTADPGEVTLCGALETIEQGFFHE
jgi:hypothetical protein